MTSARGVTRRTFLQAGGALAAGTVVGPPRAWAATDPFAALDATAQAELVRRKEVTPLELVDAAIRRIELLDPKLNAFTATCFDRARDQARGELPDGPFRGVPYAVKDLVDYEGMNTTYGSRLFEDNIADENTDIVQSALDAGLVILGKTATPEFGLLATTESLLLGPTRNPWNLERTPGGSSGGAAAAVASGMLAFAQGSDGGGSIRNPASCCGVFGLKPSRGRVPRAGRALPGEISVRFALSRSVRDSARLLVACQASGPEAPLPPLEEVLETSTRRLRIAFTTDSVTGVAAHPHVVAALERTAQLCADLGHEVVPVGHPIAGEQFVENFLTLWASVPATLEDYAWVIGLTQFRFVSAADVLEPWTVGLAQWLDERPSGALERAVASVEQVGRQYAKFFEDYDVQLTPVLQEPPIRIGEQAPDLPFDTLLERIVRYSAYTPPYNAAGAPAMSVPLSWSPDGLPIGSQFGTRVGGEATLLQLAYELEAARPWKNRWPDHSALLSAR